MGRGREADRGEVGLSVRVSQRSMMVAICLGSFYLLGLAVAPFVPETRGKPLPL